MNQKDVVHVYITRCSTKYYCNCLNALNYYVIKNGFSYILFLQRGNQFRIKKRIINGINKFGYINKFRIHKESKLNSTFDDHFQHLNSTRHFFHTRYCSDLGSSNWHSCMRGMCMVCTPCRSIEHPLRLHVWQWCERRGNGIQPWW